LCIKCDLCIFADAKLDDRCQHHPNTNIDLLKKIPAIWLQFECAEILYGKEILLWTKPNHIQVPQDVAQYFAPCPAPGLTEPSELWFPGYGSDAESESDDGKCLYLFKIDGYGFF
jgi:hypothetical protein